MKNADVIRSVIDYIDENLDHPLDLEEISSAFGYSRYHLSRMFTYCAGFSLHEYVSRRKLTEAARALAETDRRIIDIALDCGYENQQSFTVAFSGLYGCTPAKYRSLRCFAPLQLHLHVSPEKHLQGDRMMDIRFEKQKAFRLIGFKANTGKGFQVIGLCWRQLHGRKQEIADRCTPAFLTGLNDYTAANDNQNAQPAFDYYACAEVTSLDRVPSGMTARELPASDYVVFTYRGRAEDSMEPVVNYIYREWFPESGCVLNENAQYDFVRYGENTDENGNTVIEYWVPVLTVPAPLPDKA